MNKRTLKTLLSFVMVIVGAFEITFGVQNITRGFDELEKMLKKEK